MDDAWKEMFDKLTLGVLRTLGKYIMGDNMWQMCTVCILILCKNSYLLIILNL